MAKDLFSKQSEFYAKYRPTYPQELFDYILGFVETREVAWDCATGNGQAAKVLADYFKRVEATDISEAQIARAAHKPNIHYQVCPAEETPFADNTFDLITVATAYHWLNWQRFFTEATRVGTPDAVVAAWAYNLCICDDEQINASIQHFYYDVIYPYWDSERRHVENAYATVEFNFDPLPAKDFDLQLQWTKEQLLGYLNSWSAVQNFIRKNNSSPVSLIEDDLAKSWNDDQPRRFHFPLFLKNGRVVK